MNNNKIKRELEKFTEQVDKLLTADDRYIKATEKELGQFCDSCFLNDDEVEVYCREKHIPLDVEIEELV